MMADAEGYLLDGQGDRLPDDFHYIGDWIVDERIFLFRPVDRAGNIVNAAIVRISYEGEEPAIGFNAHHLGFRLKTGIPKLFDHNRAGTLDYLGKVGVLSERDDSSVVGYKFRCAGEECTIADDT